MNISQRNISSRSCGITVLKTGGRQRPPTSGLGGNRTYVLPTEKLCYLASAMQLLALILVAAAGLWLIAVAILMAARPEFCIRLMLAMREKLERSNWPLQFTEQGLRVLTGLALIIRAPASKLPFVFEVAGWILVATSLLIMAAPIRWHGAYGAFLMKRLTPVLLRILSPIPAAAGAGLIYAAL